MELDMCPLWLGHGWLVSDDHMETLSGYSSLLAALTTGM